MEILAEQRIASHHARPRAARVNALRRALLPFVRAGRRLVGPAWRRAARASRMPAACKETPMSATVRQSSLRYAIVVCAAVVAAVFVAGSTHAAGLDMRLHADAKDVGLPVYPGAVKTTSGGDKESGAFSMGLWGDSFGFKLAVVSFRSTDSVDAVAAFYRDAMGQYGPVLDCTNVQGKGRHDGDDKDKRDKPVTCDGDKAATGGRLFKVGVNRAQRVFDAKPDGSGATFTLVRIEMRGDD
jgi:hypothetical protein